MDFNTWSERTVLLDLSSAAESPQRTSEIMLIWDLLNINSESLRLFNRASFIPSETKVKVGEGSTYRVDIEKLHGTTASELVAVKNVNSPNAPLTAVLHELRIQTHPPLQNCPNLVRLIGYGWDTSIARISLYLVVEYSSFGTLKQFLSATEGTISWSEKLGYCQDVAIGLEALHGCSIAHGDVKMENTLVFAKPGTPNYIIKLSDFGSALTCDNSRYLGTDLLNAPETRNRDVGALRSLEQHFKSDIFSYGLLVWEVLQDGQRYQKFGAMPDPVQWLNSLPKDELLRSALQALNIVKSPTMTTAMESVFGRVLKATIRDDPEDRAAAQTVVDLYRSGRAKVFETAADATARVVSILGRGPLKIPNPSDFGRRRLNQILDLPVAVQTEIFHQFESTAASNSDPLAAAQAKFNLSMSFEIGFGVKSNTEKMLNLLREAAFNGVPQAAALCVRIHSAFHQPLVPSMELGHIAYLAEMELQHVPYTKYFSTRIRVYERSIQRAILRSPFDVYRGTSIIAQQMEFGRLEQLRELVRTNVPHFSEWRIALVDHEYSEFATSLVHYAARLGHLPLLRILLEEGADIDSDTTDGRTLLTSACMGGHTDILEFIIQKGARLTRRSPTQLSPLHWVIMFDEEEQSKVIALLRGIGASIDDTTDGGFAYLAEHTLVIYGTPLHTAIATRNQHLCQILIEAGASLEQSDGNITPLEVAVLSHIPELTKLLLSSGKRKPERSPLLALGSRSAPLHLLHGSAACSAFTETVDIVSAAGFDINAEDEHRWTPLANAIHRFASTSKNDNLEVLISKGALITFTSQETIVQLIGGTPLSKHYSLTTYLIEKRILNTRLDGQSLLHGAARRGYPEIMRAILDLGVDVDDLIVDEDGVLAPLHCAVLIKGNGPAVRLLVERGANLSAISINGCTALTIAVMLPIGDGEVIDILINHGANLEYVASGIQSTVIHLAAHLSSQVDGRHVLFHLLRHECVRELYDSLDGSKTTPLQHATVSGNLEAIEALIDAGANLDSENGFSAIRIVQELGRFPRGTDDEDEIYLTRLRSERIIMALLDKEDLAHESTPLHIAASIGNDRRVVELVEAGADIQAENRDHKTPISYTQEALVTVTARTDLADGTEMVNPRCALMSSLVRITEFLQVAMFRAAKDAEQLNVETWDYPERAQAEKLIGVETKTRDLGPSHPETLKEISLLGKAYAEQGNWEAASACQEGLVVIRKTMLEDTHPDLLEAQSDFLHSWIHLGKLDEAEELANYLASVAPTMDLNDPTTLRRVLDISIVERALGHWDFAALTQESMCTDDTPYTPRVLARIQLGITNCMLQRWSANETLLRTLLSEIHAIASEQSLGSDIISGLMDLASVYESNHLWQESEPLRLLTYDQLHHNLGDNSHYPQIALSALSRNLREQGKLDRAVAMQTRLLGLTEERYAARCHPRILEETYQLALCYQSQSRWVECEVLLVQPVADMKIVFGRHHSKTLAAMETLATALSKQGLWERAEIVAEEKLKLWREVVGDGHRGTISSLAFLSSVKLAQEKLDEVGKLEKDVIDGLRLLLDATHGETTDHDAILSIIGSKQERFQAAEELYLALLHQQQRRLGEEHTNTVDTMIHLSNLYNRIARLEDASAIESQIYNIRRRTLGETNPDTLAALAKLSETYTTQDKPDKIVQLLQPFFEHVQRLDLIKNEPIIAIITILGLSMMGLGRWKEAEHILINSLTWSQDTLGREHRTTLDLMFGLAYTYHQLGLLRKAKVLAQEQLSLEQDLQEQDIDSIHSITILLAGLNCELEDWPEAEKYCRQVWKVRNTTLGDDHPDTISSLQCLLDVSMKLELWERVQPLRILMLDHFQKTLGEDNPDSISALKGLSSVHAQLGDWKAVQRVSSFLLDIYNKLSGGEETEETVAVKSTVALAYWKQSRLDEAEKLQLQIARFNEKRFGKTSQSTLEALAALARTYREQIRLPEAEELERHILAERKKQLGESDPMTIEAMWNLGDTLIARECWQEAERAISTVAKEWESRYGEVSVECVTALKAQEKTLLGQERIVKAEALHKRWDYLDAQVMCIKLIAKQKIHPC